MNADDLVPGGFPCDQQAAISLPPREDVVHTDHWRVAHAFNSALPGWLVLLPTRHVASFTELTPEAADELGGLVRRLGGALERSLASSPCVQQRPPRVARPVTDPARRIVHGTDPGWCVTPC